MAWKGGASAPPFQDLPNYSPVWQPRSFDRDLRSVKEYREKVGYLHLGFILDASIGERLSREVGVRRTNLPRSKYFLIAASVSYEELLRLLFMGTQVT
jgi:hypothetical protein